MLNRECTSDYPLPDSKLTIPRGTPILIPIYGIQRDSNNFNDPLDYRPERFVEQSTSGMAYMPFGEGPRHCIGMWCPSSKGNRRGLKRIFNFLHSFEFPFHWIFFCCYFLIAQRMGMLNVKVAIVQVLKHFRIHLKPEVEEMEIGNFGIPIMPKNGVFVELSRKEKQTSEI